VGVSGGRERVRVLEGVDGGAAVDVEFQALIG